MRVAIMTALLTIGVAQAQGTAPAAPAEPAPTPSVAPEKDKASEVPDPEKLRQSADALKRMGQVLKDVLSKLEEARNTKDVVKLNCVNEKLTQVKGLLRISEQSDVALQEAVAKRESLASEHEFTKVTIAKSKVEQLRAETEECIGQLAFRTDENLTVEVEVPDDLPSGDPSKPDRVPEIFYRAPAASPTR